MEAKADVLPYCLLDEPAACFRLPSPKEVQAATVSRDALGPCWGGRACRLFPFRFGALWKQREQRGTASRPPPR